MYLRICRTINDGVLRYYFRNRTLCFTYRRHVGGLPRLVNRMRLIRCDIAHPPSKYFAKHLVLMWLSEGFFTNKMWEYISFRVIRKGNNHYEDYGVVSSVSWTLLNTEYVIITGTGTLK
jgi:hypothetical protein